MKLKIFGLIYLSVSILVGCKNFVPMTHGDQDVEEQKASDTVVQDHKVKLDIAATTPMPAPSTDISFVVDQVRGLGNGTICQLGQVQTTSAGDQSSLVFPTIGLTLVKEVRKLTFAWNTCHVSGILTLPQGYYFKSLEQTVYSGIVKDKKITGALSSTVMVRMHKTPTPFGVLVNSLWNFYNRNDELNNPLDLLEKKVTVLPLWQKLMYYQSRTMKLQYRVDVDTYLYGEVGLAPLNQQILMNIDNIDLTLTMSNIAP